MKTLAFIFLLIGGTAGVFAQTPVKPTTTVTGRSNINTGVQDLDNDLNEINEVAGKNPSGFVSEVAGRYGVQTQEVQNMMTRGMQPAEVFLVYETVNITRKPVNQVAETYEKNKGKGWGVLAKELGIKPGSKEFFALKEQTRKEKVKLEEDQNTRGTDNGNGKQQKEKEKEKDKEKKDKGNGKGKK